MYWLKLLHFEKRWFGGARSLADNSEFFFSVDGAGDAQAEKTATIAAMMQITDEDRKNPNRHAQCRFPERQRFLREQNLIRGEVLNCPDFLEWKNSLDVRSVTLIFASAYAHTPASLFGHTFLRLNSFSRQSIRDYGINFAALTGQEGIFTYAFKGVFGGYPGIFSISPYYTKLNEYIFVENRDIWEYDLKLSAEQIDRLVNHLWELLANAQFDYYYADENCSYQILGLLEVANPEWRLTNFEGYVIPLETLKVVHRADATSERRFRGSLRRTLGSRTEELTRAEKKRFQQIVREPEASLAGSSRSVLDAASAYLFFRKQKARKKWSAKDEERLHEILVARSRIDENSPSSEHNSVPPETGHPPYRIGFAIGTFRESIFEELSFRPGVHDLLNRTAGYSEFSELSALDLKLRYWNREGELKFHELELFRITSIAPLSFVDRVPSYHADIGYVTTDEQLCEKNCQLFRARGSFGPALSLPGEGAAIWALGLFQFESPSDVSPGGGVGLQVGLIKPWGLLRTLLEYEGMETWEEQSGWRDHIIFSQAYSFGPQWEAKARLKWSPQLADEARAEMSYFF